MVFRFHRLGYWANIKVCFKGQDKVKNIFSHFQVVKNCSDVKTKTVDCYEYCICVKLFDLNKGGPFLFVLTGFETRSSCIKICGFSLSFFICK